MERKDRIRRNALIQQIEKSGLKMVDIKSVILAQQVTWVLRMQKECSQAWSNVLIIIQKNMVVYLCLIAILICPMKINIDSEKNTQ